MIIHSFNGGGIRGLMIAFIMKISEIVFGKAKKPQIYAGTSVGSIVATLRALGYEWPDVCNFFTELGPVIFKKPFFPRIFRSKYKDTNFNEILKKYIGENTLLSDVKDCILLIPTCDTTTDSLKVWSNVGDYQVDESGNHRYVNKPTEDAKLWEVVRASCSAPRYFARFKVNKSFYEDGGLKANNPSQIAYNVARSITSDPICILSVTTGRKTHKMKESQYNDGIQVASHVIDSTLDAIDENTHFSMSQIVRPCDLYFRIETKIVFSSGEVDDVTKDNMSNMIKDADESIQSNYNKLKIFFSNPSNLVI